MEKNKFFKLASVISILFPIFLFSAKPILAAQCEYIPRNAAGNIIYLEGSSADYQPWIKEMDEEDCLKKCRGDVSSTQDFASALSSLGIGSIDLVRSLLSTQLLQCAGSSIFPEVIRDLIPGIIIYHNPENCDLSRTTCGPTNNPSLTVKCKFTPKKSDETILNDDAWETLTTSETECQNLCDTSKHSCQIAFPTSRCDDAKTTCEATPLAPTTRTSPLPYTFTATAPRLEIPLPTLPQLSNFMPLSSTGEVGNRYLLIPWIGEYIAAMYKYAIGITGVLAGIMIVVAGLIWLTAGGSAERISTAKSYIEGAMVGLVIALTSYVILYAVNPNLVGFEAMKVKFVERVVLPEGQDSFVDTVAASSAATSEGGPISTSQSCDPGLPNCHITFEAPLDAGTGPGNPRALEFMQKVGALLTGGTTRDKVKQAAEEAANCCVVLGCCAEADLRINFVAGVPDALAGSRGVFIENLRNGLGASTRGKVRKELNRDQKAFLDEMNCDGTITDCKTATQIRLVYERLRREIPGYPDTWAEELVPGDSAIIFNANSSPRGGHAIIFMGWTGRDGVANVIQGSPGKVVKRGTACLKSTCGTPFPFNATFKPEP